MVVRAEQRRGRLLQPEQPRRHLTDRRHIIAQFTNDGVIDLQTSFRHGLQVPVIFSAVYRTGQRAVDQADPPMPQFQQMLHRLPGAGFCINGYQIERRRVNVRKRRLVSAEHKGNAFFHQLRDQRIIDKRSRYNDAAHRAAAHQLHAVLHLFGLICVGCEKRGVSILGQHLCHTL